MQVHLAASQPHPFLPLPSRSDSVSHSSLRAKTSMFFTFAMLLAFSPFFNPGYCAEPAQSGFQRLFHLAGIPGLRREERVNLTADSDGLLFQAEKIQYQVPYTRIHQVLLLNSDRRYEGRTYALAVATYGVGALLILKKHHVDTVVLDYVNERGGKMGIVLQMEMSQGEALRSLLKSRGIAVEEPEALSVSQQQSETGTTDRSKQ